MPTDLGKTYEFKCFVPLEAKDIAELELFGDPFGRVLLKIESSMNMAPKEVIFAPPATIVYWQDGSRTVVKCGEEDEFSEEIGFVLCFMKKWFGNTGKFNDYINDALVGAKRYYPDLSSDVPDYIKKIKDDVVRIFSKERMTRTIYDGVSKLPSAERRGRWIYNANFAEPPFKCSACGKSQGRLSTYCPVCGSFNGEGGENDELQR